MWRQLMKNAATDNPPQGGQSSGRPGFASGEGANSALEAMIKKREMGENEPQSRDDAPPMESGSGA